MDEGQAVVGCSGWNDRDWRGIVRPPKLPRGWPRSGWVPLRGGGRRMAAAVAALLLVGCVGGREREPRAAGTLARPGADGAIETGGSSQEGSITDQAPRVRHAFAAQEGQRLVVSAEAASGSDLDPYLRLYGPDGELLTEDDDGGDDLDSQAVVVARRSGRHVAEVAAYRDDSTGAYTVAVERDEPPSDG